ncbi:MAG: inositol monophosphatase [Ignavibacteriae bacterium]|nr:inositol monophosphatase [Ignavibacteria bacterium]MBI3365193.1 inositol monophosphatase [Ignavibacteriota bacterium]
MLDIAIEAARSAGKYLKQNLGRVRQIRLKEGEEKNLVTEIDKGSEEIIIDTIKKHFPVHDILAEESGRKHGRTSEYRWVIDPLDGTTNFTHGFPVFCVSIALERKGEIILGVIYDPNFDEIFTAEQGKGAFLNGKKMSVSRIDSLTKSLLVTGFPYNITKNPDHAVEHFVNFLMRAQAVRRMGSAAIDLAYVAAGRYEGFWEVALNPWDMAAGALLVTEAGGKITDFSGNPFSIYRKEILASNGLVHDEMMQVLRSFENAIMK